MPFVYRVANHHPKDVKKHGGFTGTETTILPNPPSGVTFPQGSFCAALLDDVGLTPAQMKLALTRFRPPPSQGTPFLYRLNVPNDAIVRLGNLPEQCFVGNGQDNGANLEVVITSVVLVNQIEVYAGKWVALDTLKD